LDGTEFGGETQKEQIQASSQSDVISSGCLSRIMGLINTMTVSLYSSGLDFDSVSEQIKTPSSQQKHQSRHWPRGMKAIS